LKALENIKSTTAVEEVMLYTLARPSNQPEAENLKALSPDILDNYADAIRQLGFKVSVSY